MGEHDILSKVLTMDTEKIRRTLEEQSNEGFEAVADSIIAARISISWGSVPRQPWLSL